MSSLLIAGDIHDNRKHLVTILDAAVTEGCDKVFAVGDFGAWEHYPDGVQYFDEVNLHADVRGLEVYFLDGNHDKSSLVESMYGDQRDDEGFMVCRPHLRYAPRGHRWTWYSKDFIALGGAYSVDKQYRLAREEYYGLEPGTLWFPEEEMTDDEMEQILRADSSPVDVMLTHDKPRSAKPDWNRKDLPECWPNQDRIQRAAGVLRPAILVHGHLHYRYDDTIRYGDGDWTKVVGLDCDPPNADSSNPADSWIILELSNQKETL